MVQETPFFIQPYISDTLSLDAATHSSPRRILHL